MNSIKNAIILALAIVIVVLLYNGCTRNNDFLALQQEMLQLKAENQSFKTKIQNDSSTISSQNQVIVTQQEANRTALVELQGEIQKLQAQVKQKQQVRYDSVKIAYVPQNFADTTGWYRKLIEGERSIAFIDSLMAHTIFIPKKIKLEDRYIKLSGTVNKENVTLDSLKIENESTVIIGWKKTGFLKLNSVPMVEIRNTNPHLVIKKMDNIVINKKKGLLQKPTFWAALGFLGGLFVK